MGGMACCGTSLDRKDPKNSFLDNPSNISAISHRSNISHRNARGGAVDPKKSFRGSSRQDPQSSSRAPEETKAKDDSVHEQGEQV
jgi:hypothetical protein